MFKTTDLIKMYLDAIIYCICLFFRDLFTGKFFKALYLKCSRKARMKIIERKIAERNYNDILLKNLTKLMGL